MISENTSSLLVTIAMTIWSSINVDDTAYLSNRELMTIKIATDRLMILLFRSQSGSRALRCACSIRRQAGVHVGRSGVHRTWIDTWIRYK